MKNKKFEVGDVIDTKNNSNMKGKCTIRKVEGRKVFFTDSKGQDYQGMMQSDVRKLVEGDRWEVVELPVNHNHSENCVCMDCSSIS